MTGEGVALFADDAPGRTTEHGQPAWKLVVAVGGALSVTAPGRSRRTATGVLVPPELPHAVAAGGGYRCLLVEPWVPHWWRPAP